MKTTIKRIMENKGNKNRNPQENMEVISDKKCIGQIHGPNTWAKYVSQIREPNT